MSNFKMALITSLALNLAIFLSVIIDNQSSNDPYSWKLCLIGGTFTYVISTTIIAVPLWAGLAWDCWFEKWCRVRMINRGL
jgi:hypothetical protein